jgi:mannose-6-phosphate isomerase
MGWEPGERVSTKNGTNPLVLRPVLKQRVWGVERLPAWYPQPEPGQPVGEAWLTAEECVAADGAAAGHRLSELAQHDPTAFAADADGFPLLIKMLFPREKLSVQVHPNDAEAQALGHPRGKTECWYIVAAEPGATVAVGLREPLSPQQVREAISDGSIEHKLRQISVKAGDMVYVPAGTIHAILPGVTILETQEYSDITYRLYDYGRPRELHLEQGLAALRSSSEAGLVTPMQMEGFVRLVTSPYFAVDRFCLNGEVELGGAGTLQILVALAEGCSLGARALPAGWAVVVPVAEAAYPLRGSGDVVRVALP